jgi:3-carboxy-cis,cis-muconate cycloisomerase
MPEQYVHFTDGRVPTAAIRPLFAMEHRWQRWLDVEAALADAEAEIGIIPQAAAKAIRHAASLDRLDVGRIRQRLLATSHPLMALVSELSDATGEPYGGWVHWGATTQNITQTGDMLVLREAHEVLLRLLAENLDALGDLAERGAGMVMAGRTHGQQAVPITFGLKAATWIDEMIRHAERLKQVEPRVFTAMVGGAVGSFGSLGAQGLAVQESVARRLGLLPMEVPARSISDSLAEYVCILGLLASTGGRIAGEIYSLMKTEVGEVREPAPAGTIGSSTMPHKYNPQLADDCLAISAHVRALVPLAMEGMLHDHEVNGANSMMTDTSVHQAIILCGDLFARLAVILPGLELDEKRMRANLELTGGLVTSEAVMLTLGEVIGRQRAHDVVYEAAQTVVREGKTFAQVLASDPLVSAHLDSSAIQELLNPMAKTGLSVAIAHKGSERAHHAAAALNTVKM